MKYYAEMAEWGAEHTTIIEFNTRKARDNFIRRSYANKVYTSEARALGAIAFEDYIRLHLNIDHLEGAEWKELTQEEKRLLLESAISDRPLGVGACLLHLDFDYFIKAEVIQAKGAYYYFIDPQEKIIKEEIQ